MSAVFQQQFVPQRSALHIGTWSYNSNYLWMAFHVSAALVSAAWPSNNRALYVPIYVPTRFTVARFLVLNGSNATGNVDVGLYSNTGSKLMSTGSTARSGTSVAQYIGVTDQSFSPGAYYLALVGSSTTGQYMRTVSTSVYDTQVAGYLFEDLGATTLPSSMTPSAYTVANAYHWGFTQSDTL